MPALEDTSEPDDMSGGFRWIIPNWSTIRSNKHRSERFVVGGFSWQLLVFPQGNSCDHLSVYLDVAEPDSYLWVGRSTHSSLWPSSVRMTRRNT